MLPSPFPCWFIHEALSKSQNSILCHIHPLVPQSLWAILLPEFLLTLLINSQEKKNLSVVGYGDCGGGGKKGAPSPGGVHQLLSPSAASPAGAKPCPCLRHSRCRDPAHIPGRSSTHSCSPSIHQDNPIKSFTGRTWRWQQHIITNISSLYMVIIYSIFFISAIQTEDYFMLDIILIFDPFPPQLKKD